MKSPIYRTKLLVALLILALCLPSNSYALRTLNAGMEESPVRRELDKLLNHPSEGFAWAAIVSIILGVTSLLYTGYTYVGAKISGSDIDPLGIEARKRVVIPPHRELPQQTIASTDQVPGKPDPTPLPWTSEEEFNQWYERMALLELSSPETISSVLEYLKDVQQGNLSLDQLSKDYDSWKGNPDQASLKPYQQQAVKDAQLFMGWLSSLTSETADNPGKTAELLKQRIPELEKQQKRASELLEKHLEEDPGFFSWFLDPANAEETKRDLASYAENLIRQPFGLRDVSWPRTTGQTGRLWKKEFKPRSTYSNTPEYAKELVSNETRRNRFIEVFEELLEDLEAGTGSFSNQSENNPRRFLQVLNSSSFAPAEQKLASMDPEKQLEAVLGRLPLLLRLVRDSGMVSSERARERLDSILASIGQRRLAEPLGQLIRWAAEEKMDSGKIDSALTELGVLLNQRDFHLVPSLLNRPDPLWNSWLFKIALRGNVGGKEILFVQRLRGNELTTMRGYHPSGNEREKGVGIVMMDEAFRHARDLRGAAAVGSIRHFFFFLSLNDSDKQIEKQLGQMLRRFADQGTLPLDHLELWKQAMFATSVHEYTHAVGYWDEYEARLAALAVGNPALTITDLYQHRRNGNGEEGRSYAQRAARDIIGRLEYWRSSPLDVDGPTLRRLSGTLLNQTAPKLFDHFNSPEIQRDLKILAEQISTLQPKESLRDRLMGGRLPPGRSGLEENLDRISQVAVRIASQRSLLGIGSEQRRKFGPGLIYFLDELKQRLPAIGPFILLIGEGAESYAESPSVLLAVSRTDEAAHALSLLGAGTLAYWGGLEETTAFIQQLQSRNIPISVRRIESGQLEDVLSLILGNLAGLEENFSPLEVEALYGIRLSELAAQLKQLAQIGV